MSGIGGLYRLDGRPVEAGDLGRMLDSLAHRGPDGVSTWRGGPVGLGHRRLRTTPESAHEGVARTDAGGGLVLTADARLDNRGELADALGLDAAARGAMTDGELILLAYQAWGERCVQRLLGDFAFVVWDGGKRRLVCARDHLGVKPLYYYRAAGALFAFASEIKGLLALTEVPRRLNEAAVGDYLVPLFEDTASTFYRDVFRLPPASTLTVGVDGAALRAYWALDPDRRLRLASDGEYAEAFRGIFVEATRCRLRSALPVGSMLSGGLDSSSIACVAGRLLAEAGPDRLHTVSAVFDAIPECDERAYIDAVLAGGPFEPHFLQADRLRSLTDLDRVLFHQDEPFFAPNLFLHWGLYGVAAKHGVRVLLDGFDGDTTVSHGTEYLVDLARGGRLVRLAREVRGLARNLGRSPRRILVHHVIGPLAPGPVRHAWRAMRGRERPERRLVRLVSGPLAERLGLVARVRSAWRAAAVSGRSARAHHHRRLGWGVLPFALEVADRAAAAFSLEARYPFFDRRLVEFCLAVPPSQKLAGGWTRMIQRRAMAGILPAAVQWRAGKADLSPGFLHAFLGLDGGLAREVAERDTGGLRGYVDPASLRAAYARATGAGSSEDALAVWRATTLALWLSANPGIADAS